MGVIIDISHMIREQDVIGNWETTALEQFFFFFFLKLAVFVALEKSGDFSGPSFNHR